MQRTAHHIATDFDESSNLAWLKGSVILVVGIVVRLGQETSTAGVSSALPEAETILGR